MKNVPKLRFNGFNDEWTEFELGDLAEISKSKYNPSKDKLNYKCIELEHIAQNDGRILGYVDSKEQNSIKNKFNKGEVLFGKLRPYLKKYWLSEFEGVCSSEIWVLNGKCVTNSFLYRIVQSDKFDIISNISSGSKMPRADWKFMSTEVFNIPLIEEQEKIANFLTKVDKIIEKQDEKVNNLEQYKKGMMQKIFSQEIRFKKDDGEEYPKWKEIKLDNLGETYTGLSGKTKENFGFGEGKYITYMNVFKNVKTDLNMIDLVEIKENEKQNTVLKGDILFTTSSETPEEVGMASVCNIEEENLYLNSFCFGFRLNNNSINSEYLAYLLRSPKIRLKISILAQGSTRFNLSKAELMKMRITIPCLEEQNKIVDFLSKIYSIVEKEREKLEELRVWKKGLLQGMFI